jgi:hypothetical protein
MLSIIPLPYRILLFAMIVGGAFAAGFKKGGEHGEQELARAESDANDLRHQLELEQQRIREVVKVEYVDRITKIKEKETKIVQAAAETVPGQYDMSNGWVHAHNAAASPKIDLDLNLAADGNSSFVKDNVALQTVVENYSICLQNAQQLTSLQKYLIQVNEKIDEENKKRGIDIKLPDLPWKKKEG